MFSPGWFSRSLALISVIQLFVRENVRWEMTQMFQDVFSVSSCPFITPFAAPHQMAVSNRSTYWWVYTSIQKKIHPPCYPQIIPNLKYIPQSCSKELFLHLFDYHRECYMASHRDVQGRSKRTDASAYRHLPYFLETSLEKFCIGWPTCRTQELRRWGEVEWRQHVLSWRASFQVASAASGNEWDGLPFPPGTMLSSSSDQEIQLPFYFIFLKNRSNHVRVSFRLFCWVIYQVQSWRCWVFLHLQ